MSISKSVVLVDYGCHSFTYKLAVGLHKIGYPIQYFANGSLESPNLSSLSSWVEQYPRLVRKISCEREYGKISLRKRLRGELEWAGRCVKALEEAQPSAVIVSCVPLTAMTRIASWARKRSIPLIYWLQDLQGKAIFDLLGRRFGFMGRIAGWVAHRWEQTILKRSRRIITIAAGHERSLPRRVIAENRFSLLENWANIEEMPLLPSNNAWAREHGLGETLNIVYSGTLGFKHDLSVFKAMAIAFQDRPDVRIVVVSSGQAADHIRQDAARNGLTNLVVLPFQPYEAVAEVFASAAILVAPLDPSAGSFCVPSKVLSYHCAGRPVVLAIDSANPAAQTIREAGSGEVVRPGDTQAFVEAVRTLLDDPAERKSRGDRARRYAENTFNLDIVISRFLAVLGEAGVLMDATGPTPDGSLSRSPVAAI